MATLLHVLGLLFLLAALGTAAVIGLAVWALRRLRRTTRRVFLRSAQALRSGRFPPRPHLTGLRSGLQREVAVTVALVAAAQRQGRPVGQLAAFAARLQQHARALDVDLTAASAEPDPAVRGPLLLAHAERVVELRAGCAQVREGVRAAGAAMTIPLGGLLAELGDEVTALRLRASAYSELA